ncbi:methyltransferase [Ferrimonas senticii]|uniref:methyltransferase n=1 Tax=Ferrimonas senticii TaxID=394566 RepID=UPI000410075F|nr:methyltransferase [Ferrimonas senticii]
MTSFIEQLSLERFPPMADSQLQAWDAADELLLDQHQLGEGAIWILNDHFGALGCGLRLADNDRPLYWVNDSFVAHQALAHNLEQNTLEPLECQQQIEQLQGVDAPAGIIIKLPRNLKLLSNQLDWLNAHLPAGTPVVIGARQRDMPSTLPELTRQLLDDTRPSRAIKKARLIYGVLSGRQSGQAELTSWHCAELGQTIHNLANTYGGKQLDIGARLLLENLPKCNGEMIDLGCGNGVLTIAMAKANPDCQIIATDESWHGLEACKLNSEAYSDRIDYQWNDCLSGVEGGSVDLVLCNPPFHQQQAVTDHIAWQMFRDAKRVLKTGGKLRIVGNRHLAYHIKLTRLFGGCETIAANAKFVVLEAQKRRQVSDY